MLHALTVSADILQKQDVPNTRYVLLFFPRRYVPGRDTVIFILFPSRLLALILPLWASVTALAMDRPIPYPPVSEDRDWSPR